MKQCRKAPNLSLRKLVLLCALATGCSSKHHDAPLESAAQTDATPVQEAALEKPAFSAVNDSLKAGAVDDAAARLFNMRASGRQFSQSEAMEYRKALDEVYTRALEAAEKGDPRAEAALKMIRAATAR